MIPRMVMAVAVLLATLAFACDARAEECELYTITAYSAEDYPGVMANGTTTGSALVRGIRVAAGSRNLELGARVSVSGVGDVEITDRGLLGVRHIDLLMATTAEAITWGVQTREVCRV